MIAIDAKVPVEVTVKPDLSEIFDRIGIRLLDSVQENFARGGRPVHWPAKKKGGPSFLYQTGTLYRSLHHRFGDDFARVETAPQSVIPYIFVHQYGWPKKNIPPRPYMLFQDEDKIWIKEELGERLVEYLSPSGKKTIGGGK